MEIGGCCFVAGLFFPSTGVQRFRGPVRSKVMLQRQDLADQDGVRLALTVDDQDAVRLDTFEARKCSCDGFGCQRDLHAIDFPAMVFPEAFQLSGNVCEARKAESPLDR